MICSTIQSIDKALVARRFAHARNTYGREALVQQQVAEKMLRLLRQERAELEGNYYGLRGLACDGMPRGSSPGKPTEESGLRALENGVSERLAEIAETERVLSGDEACIRACLDALNGKYKEVIVMRYVRGYSWAKISARLGTADSTARDWHTRAMERLGEVLEELPEAEALARRASRART